MIQTFSDNYESFQLILDKDLELKEMLKEIEVDFGYPVSKIRYLSIDFGTRDLMEFRNTSELRRNFLIAGDFIQKYTELIKTEYDYDYEQETDYEVFMEALRNVRRVCMRKSEETDVNRIVKQLKRQESYKMNYSQKSGQ